MLRIAVAVAFTGAIVLASDNADARPRFRMSSPSPKTAAAAPTAKASAGQPAARPGLPTEAPKPFAAARPANPQPVGGGTFVVIRGPRPASGGGDGAPAQRAAGDDASGPLRFDPTLAATDEKKPATEKDAAKPATECLTTPQAVAAKEPLVAKQLAKDQVAAGAPRKIEPAPPSTNPALLPVRSKRQAAPVVATVCYVQRDGSCVPSY